MTLADGAQVEVDHVYRPKGSLLFRSRNPTIFLKVEHENELLLPIVVGMTFAFCFLSHILRVLIFMGIKLNMF